MHYAGQSFELVVPVPPGPVDIALARQLEEAFGEEHERVYGHRAGPDEPVELVSMQVLGRGLREGADVPERVRPSRPEPDPGPPRRAWFGPEHGWVETRILRRSDLNSPVTGPAIVEEYDTTCVIPPGTRAHLDSGGNIVIEL
jgi:N-methylhydantoinase A